VYSLELFSIFNIMAIEVNDVNFEQLVVKSDKPVIVDFWAEWCGPCRMVGPIMDEISHEYDGRAIVAKCDVDSSPEVAAKYSIRNIPTVLFFKDGKIADKQVGAVPKSNFVTKLNALI
jgi:thioredoxin 1